MAIKIWAEPQILHLLIHFAMEDTLCEVQSQADIVIISNDLTIQFCINLIILKTVTGRYGNKTRRLPS